METKDTHRILGYELYCFVLLCLSVPCFICYIFCQNNQVSELGVLYFV